VDSFDGKNTLRHVKASHVFREGVLLDQQAHQIAAWQKFHDQIKIGAILEWIVQTTDPNTVALCKDVSFASYVSQLFFLYGIGFENSFHGVYLASIGLLHETNLAERSLANDTNGLKII
jgi:hypothetical protein